MARLGWCGHGPAQSAGSARRDCHGLRLELSQRRRGTRRGADLHRLVGAVAQGEHRIEAVAGAHHWRQAGVGRKVLRGAQFGRAHPEQLRALRCNRDQLEARQGIAERYWHHRAALWIKRNLALPQQHRLEILTVDARRIAAAAACDHGFLAVVALAHDLHLRGRGGHLKAALAHHRAEHVPAGVGHQLQQGLVHRHEGQVRALGRLAIGRGHRNGNIGGFAHPVTLALGLDRHAQLVAFPADPDLRHPDPVAWFGQINRRGRIDLLIGSDRHSQPLGQLDHPAFAAGHAPAHRHHRDEHVGGVAGWQLDLDHRIGAAELGDKAGEHAFALDRDQGGRLAERHPHLKTRGLARAVLGLLGDQVHPVTVVAAEPPVVLARQPDRLDRPAFAPGLIADPRHRSYLARDARGELAFGPAQPVGGGVAGRGQLLDFFLIVIGIKAPDQPPPRGDDPPRIELDRHLLGDQRLAVQPQYHQPEPQIIIAHHPAIGAHPHLQRGRVQRQPPPGGHGFTIGVGIVHLDHQGDRIGDRIADRDVGPRGAIGAQSDWQGLRKGQVLADAVLSPVAAQWFGSLGHIGAAEVVVIPALRPGHPAGEVGPQCDRQLPRPAARKIADEQRQGHAGRLDQGHGWPSDRGAHIGQLVFIDPDRLAARQHLLAQLKPHRIVAQRRALRHRPLTLSAAIGADCHGLAEFSVRA